MEDDPNNPDNPIEPQPPEIMPGGFRPPEPAEQEQANEDESTGTTELGVEHGEHADFSMKSKVGAVDRVRHNWTRPGVLGVVAAGLAVILAIVVVVQSGGGGPDETEPSERQAELAKLPSFIVINSDDQRWDTLKYMPNVRELLVRKGVTFSNSFVVNPVCCPSRAALLSGSYSHTNGVYDNKGPEGGFSSFNDAGTLGTFVDKDYETGLFGKYLNNYKAAANRGVVPRGWDEWVAFNRQGYYDYELTENGKIRHYGSERKDYSVTVLTDKITGFIRETQGPLLVYYTPPTPHLPATPLPEDKDDFAKLPKWRPSSYNEADVSDKPEYIARQPSFGGADMHQVDQLRLSQLRSLQALDRSVAEIVQTLRETGRLENTVIIYTSDNGMLWGEHRLKGKNVPYEESIRVPLVIRYDKWITKPRTDSHLIANIDIVPTIVDIAGAKAYNPDGISLVPLLHNKKDVRWRDAFLIEHYAERTTQKVPTYCAVRTERYKLVDYFWGRDELYDLKRDPRELNNRIFDSSMSSVRSGLERQLASLCDPRPPLSKDEAGVFP